MSAIGKPERTTQQRVIQLFQHDLDYPRRMCTKARLLEPTLRETFADNNDSLLILYLLVKASRSLAGLHIKILASLGMISMKLSILLLCR
jgi:hypothetical protein